MDVVGHQYVYVQQAFVLGGIFLQPFQVVQIVLLRIKTGCAIIATLDNVVRNPCETDSGSSRHPLPPCDNYVLDKLKYNRLNRGLSRVFVGQANLAGYTRGRFRRSKCE